MTADTLERRAAHEEQVASPPVAQRSRTSTEPVIATTTDIVVGTEADAAVVTPAAEATEPDLVDTWGMDSFPASDPPANW